ncbi:MAG: hypothetical protein ACLGP3_02245 [Acidobacteriota bacterium]
MLDFPMTVRLREEEHRAVKELAAAEPLVAKTTMGMGLLLLGLEQVRSRRDGFQELLRLLRQRAQRIAAGELA